MLRLRKGAAQGSQSCSLANCVQYSNRQTLNPLLASSSVIPKAQNWLFVTGAGAMDKE
jgi:hypothetical protein